jgi:hypothetical protein
VIIICSVFAPCLAVGGSSQYSVGSGKITGVLPGIVYINGNSGKIYIVGHTSKESRIYVQTLGSSDLNIGELVEFKGKVIKFLSSEVVDTNDGYLYRPDWLKIQEQMAKKVAVSMAKERSERERKMAEFIVKGGNPNTIPITMMETKAQKEEIERKEEEAKSQSRFNIFVSLMGFVIALLTIEKVPPAVRGIYSLSKSFTGKLRRSGKGDLANIQTDARDP